MKAAAPRPSPRPHGLAESGASFAERIIDWQRTHGRNDLPWQWRSGERPDAYRVWLSEIMLQQTQVSTVIPYYERFLAAFPTLPALAAASVDEVMALWSGLGYYARARNLHRCAGIVVERHGGEFPRGGASIAELPGIGRSTANAIAAFCFGERAPILDGNVKRVLCRSFGVDGYPGEAAVERALWQLAEQLLPSSDIAIYLQGQMDLGATVCTRSKPRCDACPVADSCVAHAEGCTGDLPAARPRAAVPQRHSSVLVLLADDRVLLERRPPQGIWGGLLSLPELPAGTDPAAAARQLNCVATAFRPLPQLQHTFTHFRLTLTPLLAEVDSLPAAQEPLRQWLPLQEIEDAALPTPIRRILRQLITDKASRNSRLPAACSAAEELP
jgi:A/G-specific adenine glycosylase